MKIQDETLRDKSRSAHRDEPQATGEVLPNASFSEQSQRRFVNVAVITCVGLLLWLSLVSYQNMEKFIDATDQRYHAYRLSRISQELLYALRELESVQREFLLIGEQSDLSHYYQVRRDLREAIDRLQSDTAEPESQRIRIDALRSLVGERMRVITTRIKDRRLHQRDMPVLSLDPQAERAAQDRIQSIAAEIQNAALRTFSDEHLLALKNRQRFLYTFAFADFLALGVITALIIWYQRNLRLRDSYARHESEKRFHQVATMTGEWFWEQDAQGRFLYSNEAVKAVLGYEPGEIIGKSYFDLFTRTARERVLTFVYTQGNKRRFARLINHYQHKDGREVITESTGIPVFNDQGQIVKWRGVDLDITPRRLKEATIRELDEILRLTFEHASIGIATTDLEGRLLSFNPLFCKLLGCHAEELQGRTLWDLIYGDDLSALREQFCAVTGAHKLRAELHSRFQTRDGPVTTLRVRFELARDTGQRPIYLVLAFSSGTETPQAVAGRPPRTGFPTT
ncbi:MAG: PAS domain S-box protein [Candidatus Binatia bacterium]